MYILSVAFKLDANIPSDPSKHHHLDFISSTLLSVKTEQMNTPKLLNNHSCKCFSPSRH